MIQGKAGEFGRITPRLQTSNTSNLRYLNMARVFSKLSSRYYLVRNKSTYFNKGTPRPFNKFFKNVPSTPCEMLELNTFLLHKIMYPLKVQGVFKVHTPQNPLQNHQVFSNRTRYVYFVLDSMPGNRSGSESRTPSDVTNYFLVEYNLLW